jgi:hypothetical protein
MKNSSNKRNSKKIKSSSSSKEASPARKGGEKREREDLTEHDKIDKRAKKAGKGRKAESDNESDEERSNEASEHEESANEALDSVASSLVLLSSSSSSSSTQQSKQSSVDKNKNTAEKSRIQIAQEYFDKGTYDDLCSALIVLRKEISLIRNLKEAYWLNGVINYKLGRTKIAENDFKKYKQAGGDKPELKCYLDEHDNLIPIPENEIIRKPKKKNGAKTLETNTNLAIEKAINGESDVPLELLRRVAERGKDKVKGKAYFAIGLLRKHLMSCGNGSNLWKTVKNDFNKALENGYKGPRHKDHMKDVELKEHNTDAYEDLKSLLDKSFAKDLGKESEENSVETTAVSSSNSYSSSSSIAQNTLLSVNSPTISSSSSAGVLPSVSLSQPNTSAAILYQITTPNVALSDEVYKFLKSRVAQEEERRKQTGSREQER